MSCSAYMWIQKLIGTIQKSSEIILLFLTAILVGFSLIDWIQHRSLGEFLTQLVTIILTIVVVLQFQRQAREFSLSSFQNAFFQLLQEVKEEKHKIRENYNNKKTIKQKLDEIYSNYIACKPFYDHESYASKTVEEKLLETIENPKIRQWGYEEPPDMPATRNILLLIYRNLQKNEGELKTEDAQYYTKIVSDVLDYSIIWEYYFVTAREIFKCQTDKKQNKRVHRYCEKYNSCDKIKLHYKIAELKFFQIIKNLSYEEKGLEKALKNKHEKYRAIVERQINFFCASS